MYQSIFDHDREFRTVNRLLKRYSATRVLEIGCGSGNLAGRLAAAGCDYRRDHLHLRRQRDVCYRGMPPDAKNRTVGSLPNKFGGNLNRKGIINVIERPK